MNPNTAMGDFNILDSGYVVKAKFELEVLWPTASALQCVVTISRMASF